MACFISISNDLESMSPPGDRNVGGCGKGLQKLSSPYYQFINYTFVLGPLKTSWMVFLPPQLYLLILLFTHQRFLGICWVSCSVPCESGNRRCKSHDPYPWERRIYLQAIGVELGNKYRTKCKWVKNETWESCINAKGAGHAEGFLEEVTGHGFSFFRWGASQRIASF